MRKMLLPLFAVGYLSISSFFASAGGGYISGQQGQPSQGGTGTSTVFTSGSVIFSGANGVYTQNNSQLFWDNTNNRLGIGTAAPNTTLQLLSPTASRSIFVNSPSPVLAATAGNTDAEIALFATQYSATAASMLDLLSYSTSSANPLFRVSNHWESSGGASSSGTISIGTYVGSTFTDVLNVTTGTTPGSAAGSVGVMTSVPKSTFDVAGNVSIGTYGGANVAPVNGLIVSGAVGIGTSSPANGTLVIQSTSTTNANSVVNVLNNAGTSLFRVRQDGIVGVAGTPGTDPGYIFAVRAAANQIVGIGAGNVADIRAVNDAGAAFQQLDIDGNPLRLNPGNSGNITMVVTGGSVGINTASPNTLLDVRGSAMVAPVSVALGSGHTFQVGGGTLSVTTNGHLSTQGTLPTIGACGTSPTIGTGATDIAGTINSGTGVFTSCTITFANAYTNAPFCVCNDDTTALAVRASPTATTMVCAGSFTASDVISYICIGRD